MLLVRPRSVPAESVMGYAIRLVEANALDSTSCLTAEDFTTAMGGATLRGPIAGLVGLKAADAGGLPTRFWNTRRPRYCPACLQARPVWPALWQLSLYVACHVHRTPMHESCTRCRCAVKWRRSALLSCQCGEDLRQRHEGTADDGMLSISTGLADAWLPDGNREITRDRGGAVEELLDHIWLLGSYRLARGPKAQKLANLHLLDTATEVISAYHLVVAEWPGGFFKLLDDTAQRYGDVNSGRLAARFGGLYKELFAARRRDSFQNVRKAFEQYVAERWSGQLALRNRRLSPALVDAHVWVPIAVAARELHWRPTRVRAAVSRGALRGDLRFTQSGRVAGVVHRDDLLRLKKDAAEWLSLKGVCRLLRAGKSSVKQFVRDQVLEPVAGPSVDGSRVWQFRRTDAERLARLRNPDK